MVVPTAVRMLGICAAGRPPKSLCRSLRRAHSPAADHRKPQQRTERHPHTGPDQALLDRESHQKESAKGERKPADPDHPLGAEAFLEAHRGRRRRGWRRRRVIGDWRKLWRSRGECFRRARRCDFGRRGGNRCGRGRRFLRRRWFRRRGPLRRPRRRRDRSRQPIETTLEQAQFPLENLQPAARPDRHHHAHDSGDRYREQEKDQQNDQTVHEIAPVVAAPAGPDAMSRRRPAKA
jgi:hypothetical protein